jgi:hypothetical protein
MNLFGSGGSKVKPQYTGLAIQTSTSASPIAIGMGQEPRRAEHHLSDRFPGPQADPEDRQGRRLDQTVGYTYSGTFVLSLGWGPERGHKDLEGPEQGDRLTASSASPSSPATFPRAHGAI